MNNKKIHVLFLVLDMDLGGLQRIVNMLIQKLDRKKFTPYICCMDRGGLFIEQLEASSIKSYILSRKPGLFDTNLFLNLYKILKKCRIDIIHSHNGCSSYAVLAGRLAKVKGIIHTDHGRLMPDRKGAIWEDRLSSYFIDYFIGVSNELTKYLESVIKIKRKKLMTIVNGVDVNKFVPFESNTREQIKIKLGFNATDKILGAVCRLDPIKNIEFLIKCMVIIGNEIPQSKLMIVGEGPSKNNLIKYAKELGIAKRVKFISQSDDVEKLLPIIDIYVSSSFSEGTSMTILEAMSCGLPVVASDVGGNKKLIDSTNGYLFPLNDEKTFVNSIIKLFKDPKKLEAMGNASRTKALAEFNIDDVVKNYEKIYQQCYQKR